MMGPNFRRAICSFSMILIPEILFLCTTGRFFSHKPIIIIASFLLYCLSLYFHIKVSTSDPGYIPKQLPPFAKGPRGAPTLTKALLQNPTKECALHKQYMQIPFNGRMLKIKYCSACLILRPPRTSHCSDCGLCVEKFDHHCPWVGSCIGKKNYCLYLFFLYSTTALIIFNSISSLIEIRLVALHIMKKTENGEQVLYKILENSGGSLVFLLYTAITMWFVLFLTLFHSYLIMNNQTTHEYLKKIWRDPPLNPYKYKSVIKNIVAVIFKQKIPAHFDTNKPIDLNLDTFTIIPSRLSVFQLTELEVKVAKGFTDGKTSPFICEFKDDQGSIDSNIVFP
ncbi:hypothetical protein SteCoe_25605 [Stentor coeruleus]|uniref:Palmitoyltransferase n=1 Tax=Stentor coeruleus TaxID=5963 RepID=A0A1R2BEX0_9CILI|nr:hypothetical protein SteCoe_25605 [Stentor coeruleus]